MYLTNYILSSIASKILEIRNIFSKKLLSGASDQGEHYIYFRDINEFISINKKIKGIMLLENDQITMDNQFKPIEEFNNAEINAHTGVTVFLTDDFFYMVQKTSNLENINESHHPHISYIFFGGDEHLTLFLKEKQSVFIWIKEINH